MPIGITRTITSDLVYASPFRGKVEHFAQIKIDVSALTNSQVDTAGNLKPGTVLTLAGLAPTLAGDKVGVLHKPVKVHTNNTTLAGVTDDVSAGFGVIGILNRDVMEDNLERALTAAEIAALDGAGSRLVLLLT